MSAFGGKSVTLRLTLLFATVSVSILLGLALIVGTLVERHFEEMDTELLRGKLELIEHALDDANVTALRARLDAAMVGHHGLAVAVWRADGSQLYAFGQAAFPPALSNPGNHSALRPVKWSGSKGGHFRGLATRLASPSGAVVVAVSTALDVHQHFMVSFNRTLWTVVALVAVISGLLGWVVARRGLEPLRDICRNAEEITADRLDRRLPSAAFPVELAEVARTLNAMFARLETSFGRLSAFSSDLAHELRTPLSNLLTQTQVTLSKPRSADEYREVLCSNAEEFERLSRTVADMLFLAKADNELVIPVREPVDLRAEVDGLFEFYEALAEENGVSLQVAGTASVVGDRLMLRRAIGNLVSNAFRHTPRGGRITVSLDVAGGVATTCVANTGPEIPPEHLPRLFDRFFRVDPSRARDSEGAGLGLAITRSIMRAHGGNASVRCEAGLTIFELSMPA